MDPFPPLQGPSRGASRTPRSARRWFFGGRMRAPAGLGSRGRALWASVWKGLPDGWELDEREVANLTLAARQADDVAALERAVKRDGRMVAGSAGQPRLHPAVIEIRQGRLAVARLLGELELPDAEEEPRTASSRRAQHAAQARYQRVADLAERRRNGGAA